jgi:hypothetical protein
VSARIGTLPAPRRFNVLEGHGLGKLITPLALSGARRDAAFANRIKTAIEAS